MNISDLARFVDPDIVRRGMEYVADGRVLSLKPGDHGRYDAVVRGSADYEVYVELDDDGNILDSACDCPYDLAPVCKHQAAVFAMLADHAYKREPPRESLKDLLEQAD